MFEDKSAINYNIVGRIVMKPKVTIIRQRVVIPATPDEVYDAFMDPKKHSEFTRSKATCSPRVGGKFTVWEGYISGRNLELEKGKKIVQEWVTSEWPQDYPPSRLELSFRDVGGNTELTMLHSDVPAEQANELEEGWTDFYWKPLKDYFKKRKPKS